ncbi:MAG: hypothetical protein ACLRT4_20115 [Thomasclavelia sp.]
MNEKTMLLLKDCTEKNMIYGTFVVDKEIADKMQSIIDTSSNEYHELYGEDYYGGLVQYVVLKINESLGEKHHIEYYDNTNRYLTI